MDKAELLEQYKLFLELTDRGTNRRERSSRFYLSTLSILVTVSSGLHEITLPNNQLDLRLLLSMLSLMLCALWWFHIRSFRKLNQAKFKVIEEIESQLAFPCYQREWELIQQEKGFKAYIGISRIEQVVPVMLGVLLCFFLLRSIF